MPQYGRNVERDRERLDAEYAALPGEFRARIERFRRNNADFRWSHEAYELSVCTDAVRIAEYVRAAHVTTDDPGAAITQFYKLPWAEQKRLIPELFAGHSGNSFGAACFLARLWLEQPQHVERAHGALCPLVGCRVYGCYAAYQAIG